MHGPPILANIEIFFNVPGGGGKDLGISTEHVRVRERLWSVQNMSESETGQ